MAKGEINLDVVPSFKALGETLDAMATAFRIGPDVADELLKAREKHGKQHELPFIAPYDQREMTYGTLADISRTQCQLADPSSWDLILLEEVYEFLAELEAGNLEAARVEGIQAIAMLASIIEKIDNS